MGLTVFPNGLQCGNSENTSTLTVANGGSVVQLTSKATGVEINKLTGQITCDDASLAAGAEVSFTVTNSTVELYDVVVLSIQDSPDADSSIIATVDGVAAGSFDVMLSNVGGTDTGAVILNFMVLKGSIS